MKTTRKILILLTALALSLCMSSSCFAESHSAKGKCAYDGEDINGTFTSEEFAATQHELEPGDDLEYTITYKNDSKDNTEWYMLNTVLETLEENKEQAENGGYTYILRNIGPDGEVTTLFDNSAVGGEKVVGKLQGLRQATTATGDYFYIQSLKPGESAKTYLYVGFDGETEVNDYMDTYGAWRVAYAVEPVKPGQPPTNNPPTTTRTGDSTDIMKWIAVMAAALLSLILVIISWRKDRKDGEKA